MSEPIDDEGADERPLVRPYALVRGRTRAAGSAQPLPVEAIVVTIDPAAERLPLERGAIAQLCTTPHSVAEVSALVKVPVGVVRVLVADLVQAGAVQVDLPVAMGQGGTSEREILERVLAGLEAL